jgi:tetratricopeptide (TPR) repeat protein
LLGAAYLGKEQREKSIGAFKRAHELAPAAAQPLVALVQTYVRGGKTGDARRFLNSVISENNENITAYTLLAEISLAENKTPEAIEHLNKIIAINPNAVFAYRGLTNIYLRDNEFDKAEAAIKRGLAVMPDRPILELSLAAVYERKTEFEKAIKIYEELLATNSDLLVAKNNFASLLTDHRTDQASLDKARTISAELRSSQIPQFRDTYAWAAVKSGVNLEEAVVILEGIVKENPQIDIFNYHLGEAYRRKGDAEKAIDYLTKAESLATPGSDIAKKAKQSLDLLNQ